MRDTEPVHHTFLLHPAVDVEAVVAAYATEGWQRDTGRGSLCRINGVDYRLFPMKRLGRVVQKDWRRDPQHPYDIPPGWDRSSGRGDPSKWGTKAERRG